MFVNVETIIPIKLLDFTWQISERLERKNK